MMCGKSVSMKSTPTAAARTIASASPERIAASIAIERDCSQWMNMSTARCCSAWNVPISTSNCTRVFRYSTAVASSRTERPSEVFSF